ncbi:MAG: hypothetical protein GF417_10735 [Candidatus Latescibacteria bacterium]|nr:hypothetical protein [bacterium]MBD3424901.1 hypothetical protein [Candidatus Latescibacterota bacterium]
MKKICKVTAFILPLALMVLPAGSRSASFSLPVSGSLMEQMDSSGVDTTGSWSISRLKEVLNRETGKELTGDTGWKQKKNARVAMLCALVFPGLGQMYNEKPYKAILAMGLETFYLSNILFNYRDEVRERKIRDSYDKYISDDMLNANWNYHNARYIEFKERKIDWVWWSAGLLVVLIFDAYVDAHLHDMKFEPGKNGGLALSFDF